jgi:hypothetical protein
VVQTPVFAPLHITPDQTVGRKTAFAGRVRWFTEGFDTPDLKTAKALLDELS